MSILEHVTDRHEFLEFELFTRCAHEALEQGREWIKKGIKKRSMAWCGWLENPILM